MTFDEVERLLDAGFRAGFRKPTNNVDYLGWIIISKHKPNMRILELFDESEHPELVREERWYQREPYLVLVIELKRSVHEAGDYETEGDYRQKDAYRYGSLSEVESQLQKWGYSFEQARETRELDAP